MGRWGESLSQRVAALLGGKRLLRAIKRRAGRLALDWLSPGLGWRRAGRLDGLMKSGGRVGAGALKPPAGPADPSGSIFSSTLDARPPAAKRNWSPGLSR